MKTILKIYSVITVLLLFSTFPFCGAYVRGRVDSESNDNTVNSVENSHGNTFNGVVDEAGAETDVYDRIHKFPKIHGKRPDDVPELDEESDFPKKDDVLILSSSLEDNVHDYNGIHTPKERHQYQYVDMNGNIKGKYHGHHHYYNNNKISNDEEHDVTVFPSLSTVEESNDKEDHQEDEDVHVSGERYKDQSLQTSTDDKEVDEEYNVLVDPVVKEQNEGENNNLFASYDENQENDNDMDVGVLEHHDDSKEVPSDTFGTTFVEGELVDDNINTEDKSSSTGMVNVEEENTSNEFDALHDEEGSGVDGAVSNVVEELITTDIVESSNDEVLGSGMEITSTDEENPTINVKFVNDLGVHIIRGPRKVFKGRSEGYLENLGGRNRHHPHHHHLHHVHPRHANLRRLRRGIGSAIVGGIGNTANSIATGIEGTVEAAVDKDNKKDDKNESENSKKSKASGIGSAVVDGISNTAKSIATGVEGTVEASVNSTTTTTTTTATTTVKSEEKKAESLTSTCKSQNICYGDSDCNGGKCVGAFVGTCNCNACFNFMTCTSDDGCGGLKGACDANTKRCNCQEAHRKLGYANYFDTLTKFCNHKTCNGTSDSCNGLPCSTGRCFC